jgi:hypothetical protein
MHCRDCKADIPIYSVAGGLFAYRCPECGRSASDCTGREHAPVQAPATKRRDPLRWLPTIIVGRS